MINIAIDGPSGAGKSTISKILAKKLNITYLDTGAMYRTVALYCIRNGISIQDEISVEKALKNINISYKGDSLNKSICLNGEDVSQAIREHYVSKAASDVSKIKSVRVYLVDMQRKIANECDVILDGRDITSVVLPNAKYKFYLTASPDVRAKRRFLELKEKGQDVEYDQILKDIQDRDYNDSTRKESPLIKTKDSVEIDSSNMTLDEVVDTIISYIK